ncbi:MAG: hypothetical protein E6I03_04390 [Chloroflexi bacterium]|nr:MAG: hypothetical protein E6I03_04390 [Chloroflexota bacterium]
MNKPLFAAGGLLLGGIVTGGAIFVASSGGEEEAVQVPESPSPSASLTPGGSPSPTSSSPTPIDTHAPTATPTVPEDWFTYSVPETGITLRYPPSWYALKDGGIYSWDPATWNRPSYPPESMAVSIIYGSSEFAEPRPAEAMDFSVAGYSGWQITYSKNPANDDGLTRVHEIALQTGASTLFVIASFSQTNPDERTFSQIVNSLRFAQ